MASDPTSGPADVPADDHASDVDGARRRLEAERDRLRSLRDDLRSGLDQDSETAVIGELSDYDQHPADTATETFNRERDLGTVAWVEAELADAERALERHAAGTYGTCVVCGRTISAERLRALPATPYCIEDAQLVAARAAPGVVPVRGSGVGGEQGPAL